MVSRVITLQDLRVLVRARRAELGLSQGALAERAGVSRRWVNMFERGHESAELGLTLAVLDALGLRLDATIDATIDGSTDDAGSPTGAHAGSLAETRAARADLRSALRDYDDGDL